MVRCQCRQVTLPPTRALGGAPGWAAHLLGLCSASHCPTQAWALVVPVGLDPSFALSPLRMGSPMAALSWCQEGPRPRLAF